MVVDVTNMANQDISHYLDLREIPALRQIKIISILDKHKKKSPAVDEAPCLECGGTQFVRTGTCHTCITCGTSQGCS